MRVIVTGGTGLIGKALAAALAAGGHEVIVLTRRPDAAGSSKMPDGVRLQGWDAESAQGWGELADGAGAMVNLAGEGIADGRWSAERKRRITQSRVNAGKAVLAAIEAATVKPKVLVQASAVGYYGPRGDEIITEASSMGSDFLATVCFDWEASTARVERLGVRRPVLRTGIVLSNQGGAFPKMKLPYNFFAGGKLGSGRQWLPWIHIQDQVRAIQFLIDDERAAGPFNLSAPNPVTNQEFSKVLGSVMGKPAALPAPGFAMKAALGEMATMLLEGQRAVPARLQELGFTFEYPELEAALKDILAQ
jgi:hypothetical protein